MNINPEVKAKWLEALRSEQYAQGTSYLCDDNGGYCCLGVLQMVVDGKVERHHDDGVSRCLPTSAFWARVGNVGGAHWFATKDMEFNLPNLNDTEKLTFKQIADLVEYFL